MSEKGKKGERVKKDETGVRKGRKVREWREREG